MHTQQVHKSLYRIRVPYGADGLVFLHLLKGDSIVLLDTGVAGAPEQILAPALAELGLALSDVDLILVTHGHSDHVGGNAETRRVSNARIYAHTAELPVLQSAEALAESMIAPLRALDYPADNLRARHDGTIKAAGEPAGADVVLSDGEVVDLGAGLKLRVVHTPGHTPGSVCFYWESEGVIVAGDAVQGQGSRRGNYPLYLSAPDYRRSLARLADIDFRMLCVAHPYLGGSVTNSDSLRVGEEATGLIKESMRVADLTHRVVAEAVGRLPGASKREIALAAVAELLYHVPQLHERGSGLPQASGPSLVSHLQATLDGTYPA